MRRRFALKLPFAFALATPAAAVVRLGPVAAEEEVVMVPDAPSSEQTVTWSQMEQCDTGESASVTVDENNNVWCDC